ncbi:Kinesin- motor protein, partial [Coemansia sp. RSA 2607]
MMQTPVAFRGMGRVNNASTQEKDTNIQVVVRCRDAPMRQLKTNATIVVHPVHGQDVKIDGPASVARAYHYDGVFGPKATQEHIYDKVVRPILHEVMQGYNCTIFAYGQTGTGKTYTMEGDLEGASSISRPSMAQFGSPETPTPSRMSAEAGVIPRTLYNLFYALDKQSAEYYVRVSYVELYNEELHDLLAGGDTANDMGPVGGSHLKVYESGTDKGVVIQGLEDRIVTSARDAVAALQAGATRRRVAATRCNDASSRSHAIFTITVFIRERAVTAEGEDIVKLGKLNLVDLAGSENIGRSGAQDARAREAGNINRSLLTLGRVINALVERNSYVPYRDSKLTYILKDSLGGRTRTCMIATISNSAENIEETIKTLQYASQAKGIRNRPVANKKVSKSEIVHDMQHQIEQLRRDLDAARDGTGFFITRESHAELLEDKNRYSAAIDEWRQRIAE